MNELETQEMQLGLLLHEYYMQWRAQLEQTLQGHVSKVVELILLKARTDV